jgi:hypothetical protein
MLLDLASFFMLRGSVARCFPALPCPTPEEEKERKESKTSLEALQQFSSQAAHASFGGNPRGG